MRSLIQNSFLLLCCVVGIVPAIAQDIDLPDYNIADNKGKFYIYWGWNVSGYSKSDITFHGIDHDFILRDVKATDIPTPWDPNIYLNPALITIPQTNFKIGYFFSDHYSISFGVDHMKYVMTNDQTVKMDGYIDREGSKYHGIYNNQDHVLSEDFLVFEHTDGLNYINLELNRVDDILKWFNVSKKNLEINLMEGVGFGVLLPKTKTIFLEGKWHDDFHLAGYGLNLKIGLNVTFFRYFFIQSEFKGGFIDMPDIRYSAESIERANQSFWFWQSDLLFGVKFKIAHKSK